MENIAEQSLTLFALGNSGNGKYNTLINVINLTWKPKNSEGINMLRRKHIKSKKIELFYRSFT